MNWQVASEWKCWVRRSLRERDAGKFVRKAERVARCILVSNPFGWQLRLMTPELLRSQVCRSSTEVLDTSEQWKAAMIAKGWGLATRRTVKPHTTAPTNRPARFAIARSLKRYGSVDSVARRMESRLWD